MKMVKSLLLGSAAGLVAVGAGQAADLPVKAKPVEYVKVCSLYGAGFYYMPGTDMCLKIGGWVRAEIGAQTNGSVTWGEFNGNLNQRGTTNLTFRARGYITADAREQTAYGTARGYIAVGLNTNDIGGTTTANQFSANRAFVQFAGFTAGITQSFYDYYSTAAIAYQGASFLPASDTGDPGWYALAYTAQFGNGLSATLSMEARRMTQLIYANGAVAAPTSSGAIAPGSFTVSNPTAVVTSAYGGQNLGDIVGNIRLDQAWGGAQVMGALHQINANYYGSVNGTSGVGPTVLSGGNPSNAWGWAAGAGLRLNFPMIGAGDYFQAQVNYTQGASRYSFFTPDSNWGFNQGASETYGVLSDAVYGGTLNRSAASPAANGVPSSVQLTTTWGVNASYEHVWSPQWKTSLYGAYYQVNYNSEANAMLCSIAGFGSGTLSVGATSTANAGCNNNWSVWGIGSRTQWNVSKTFYMGVDVLYEQMQGATTGGTGSNSLGSYAVGSALNQKTDANAWSARFRIHKDFLP
jgi:hypothetical protein